MQNTKIYNDYKKINDDEDDDDDDLMMRKLRSTQPYRWSVHG